MIHWRVPKALPLRRGLAMRTGTKRGLRATLAGTLLFGCAFTATVLSSALPASAAAVVQTIPVGTAPYGVSSDGTHVWVANQGDATVTELLATTGAVVQTIPVGLGPTDVSSDGTHVWVANAGDATVTELLATTGAVIHQAIPVGIGPDSVSSDGTHVWVANSTFSTVTELLASNGSLVQTILTAGVSPSGIASDGTHVWITSGGYPGYSLTELLASNGAWVQNIVLGTGIASKGVSSDGTHVWVANGGATVSELLASTGAVIQTIGVGPGPFGVSSDGPHIWVANAGYTTVTEIGTFGILRPNLAAAKRGTPYGPETLQAVNLDPSSLPYVTTLKWKKVTLPKGLKLSSSGVLSGSPNKNLTAGPSSITVQVTETVTTLNGKKKLKTPTTVQATIPLTIT